jgi:hypothetical protein
MDDAGLDDADREHAGNRLGETLEAVDDTREYGLPSLV